MNRFICLFFYVGRNRLPQQTIPPNNTLVAISQYLKKLSYVKPARNESI